MSSRSALRRSPARHVGWLSACCVVLVSAAVAQARGARFSVIDLGPASATSGPLPVAINDLDQVIAFGGSGGGARLWLPQPSYGMPAGWSTLSAPPGWTVTASAINNHGHVGGTYSTGTGLDFGSAIWLPTPAFGRPAGWSTIAADGGHAAAINNRAQIAGHYHWTEQAYVWLPEPAYGLPPGQHRLDTQGWGFGLGINDVGAATGHSFGFPTTEPFLWLPEPMYGRPAGTHLLGIMSGDTETQGDDINIAGQVVGSSRHTPSSITFTRAFIWLPQPAYGLPAGYHDLGGYDPAVFHEVTARAVNDLGQIVGRRNLGNNALNAWLWEPGVGMQDLNALIDPASGWVLRSAIDINENGTILGEGRFNGEDRIFLLVIPEPTVIAPLLLALAALRTPRRRP